MASADTTGQRTSRVTLQHIAERLSISPATVSRALSGRTGVSEAMRSKVQRLAKTLGYETNRPRRSTHAARSLPVAFVSQPMRPNDIFYPPILGSFQRAMQVQGIPVMLVTQSEPGVDQAGDPLEALIERTWLRGSVFAGPRVPDAVIRNAIGHGYPVVLVDNLLRDVDCQAVVPDNAHGTYTLTQHLIAHGARNLSYVGGPTDWYSTRERLMGFLNALHESGLQPHSVIHQPVTDMNGGLSAGTALLRGPGQPDAIVAVNDAVALGVLEAARHQGRSVPDSLLVCGFDDTQLARLSAPPLSSCRIDLELLGSVAAERMLAALRHPEQWVPQHIVVPVRPVFRQSCGCSDRVAAEDSAPAGAGCAEVT